MPKQRTPSQRGKHSRRKGAQYEREIANALKPVYPNAKRGIGQTRSAGEVPDVDGTPWWVETKAHKRVNVRKAYEQAIAAQAARPAMLPVLVVHRDTGKCDLVTMSLAQFIEREQLYARLQALVAAMVGDE